MLCYGINIYLEIKFGLSCRQWCVFLCAKLIVDVLKLRFLRTGVKSKNCTFNKIIVNFSKCYVQAVWTIYSCPRISKPYPDVAVHTRLCTKCILEFVWRHTSRSEPTNRMHRKQCAVTIFDRFSLSTCPGLEFDLSYTSNALPLANMAPLRQSNAPMTSSIDN